MGVKGLYPFLVSVAPGAVKTVPISEFAGRRVVIDASLVIYQWYMTGRRFAGSTGQNINHLQGALSRVGLLQAAGVVPVFVFDGKPPVIKDSVMESRRKSRAEKPETKVPSSVFDDVKVFLRALGAVVIQADGEAEALCARLVMSGYASAAMTEDLDVLAFGAPRVIVSVDTRTKKCTVIDLAAVLAALTLSMAQFIDLCIIAGTDYTTDTLPGVGLRGGWKLLREKGIIENFGMEIPSGFTFSEARREFITPTVTLPTDILEPTPDLAYARAFAIEKGVSEARLKNLS